MGPRRAENELMEGEGVAVLTVASVSLSGWLFSSATNSSHSCATDVVTATSIASSLILRLTI